MPRKVASSRTYRKQQRAATDKNRALIVCALDASIIIRAKEREDEGEAGAVDKEIQHLRGRGSLMAKVWEQGRTEIVEAAAATFDRIARR